MDEYADRYFETTLKCLTMNMPDLFSVDLSHHDLSQGKRETTDSQQIKYQLEKYMRN
jgi:hypothetical protein